MKNVKISQGLSLRKCINPLCLLLSATFYPKKLSENSFFWLVFIKKTHRDTASVTFDIRTICMDDFPAITNIDEYIGFLYGMYSSNHDIECVFIDGILKHADISLDNIPAFIDRLKQVSKECEVEFYVSISASKEDLADVNMEGCKYLN